MTDAFEVKGGYFRFGSGRNMTGAIGVKGRYFRFGSVRNFGF